jgi:hypothetical protein
LHQNSSASEKKTALFSEQENKRYVLRFWREIAHYSSKVSKLDIFPQLLQMMNICVAPIRPTHGDRHVKPNDIPDLLPSLLPRVLHCFDYWTKLTEPQLTESHTPNPVLNVGPGVHDMMLNFVLFIPIPINYDGNFSPETQRRPKCPQDKDTSPGCR